MDWQTRERNREKRAADEQIQDQQLTIEREETTIEQYTGDICH